MDIRIRLVSWLLAAALAVPAPVRAESGETKRINPNIFLALVNGTVAGASAFGVAYEQSGRLLPSLAVGATQFMIFGGWQYKLDQAVGWMAKPYSWDKTASGFPTGVTKLGLVNLVCVAAVGCVTYASGLSKGTPWETAFEVVTTSLKSLAVGVPVYEAVKLYTVENPTRKRRFLLNFAPFLMEVSLNMAQVADLIGMKGVSNAVYGAILMAGNAVWMPTLLARGLGQTIKEKAIALGTACRNAAAKLMGRGPPKLPP